MEGVENRMVKFFFLECEDVVDIWFCFLFGM